MSKMFVSKHTIDALVTAALTWGGVEPGVFTFRPAGTMRMRTVGWQQADELGGMLWRQNWETVEAWQDGVDAPVYEFELYPGTPDALVVLKTIGYYEYQTETDPEIWDLCEAAGFTRYLRGSAEIRLDGWSDAPWGLDDRMAFARS